MITPSVPVALTATGCSGTVVGAVAVGITVVTDVPETAINPEEIWVAVMSLAYSISFTVPYTTNVNVTGS